MRAQSTAGNFRNVHAAFDFGAATVEEVDECVEVTDSMAGSLGTVCAADGPRTFTYTKTVGPFPTCGTHTVSNTASYRGADSGATGSASAGVEVNVPCAGGCPLSAGAWRLLATYGGMKADQVARLLQLALGAPGVRRASGSRRPQSRRSCWPATARTASTRPRTGSTSSTRSCWRRS